MLPPTPKVKGETCTPMPGCGYVCPVCEGKGWLPESLQPCDYCTTIPKQNTPTSKEADNIPDITEEDWLGTVHNQCTCGDL